MEWLFNHLWIATQLAFAGIWAALLHKGLLYAVIGVSLFAAYGTQVIALIPVVGPALARVLSPLRWDLLVVAFGAGLLLVGEHIGSRDEAGRCTAKTVVIEKVVDKAVEKSKSSKGFKDPWDNPEN